MPVPAGEIYAWDPASTYIKSPPFFAGMRREPTPPGDVRGARVLALLGDSVTTDHISPAGSIAKDGPAGKYLIGLAAGPKTSTPTAPGAGNPGAWRAGRSPTTGSPTTPSPASGA